MSSCPSPSQRSQRQLATLWLVLYDANEQNGAEVHLVLGWCQSRGRGHSLSSHMEILRSERPERRSSVFQSNIYALRRQISFRDIKLDRSRSSKTHQHIIVNLSARPVVSHRPSITNHVVPTSFLLEALHLGSDRMHHARHNPGQQGLRPGSGFADRRWAVPSCHRGRITPAQRGPLFGSLLG